MSLVINVAERDTDGAKVMTDELQRSRSSVSERSENINCSVDESDECR